MIYHNRHKGIAVNVLGTHTIEYDKIRYEFITVDVKLPNNVTVIRTPILPIV